MHPRERGRQSVSDGTRGRKALRPPREETTADDVRSAWLHADDAHRRPPLLDRCSDARDETAPSNRDDDRLYVRSLVQDLQAGGPLSRNDRGIIKGVNHGESPLLADGFAFFQQVTGGLYHL